MEIGLIPLENDEWWVEKGTRPYEEIYSPHDKETPDRSRRTPLSRTSGGSGRTGGSKKIKKLSNTTLSRWISMDRTAKLNYLKNNRKPTKEELDTYQEFVANQNVNEMLSGNEEDVALSLTIPALTQPKRKK